MARTEMLCYKAWLDTRWRFAIGFVILAIMAAGIVFNYSVSAQAIATAGRDPGAFTTNTALTEAIRIEQTYRGFVWYQWFRQNLLQTGTLIAALLGSGGVIAGLGMPSSSPGGLFTLSLPASRHQWMFTRAATGLGEFFVLATVPSVAISALSPVVGQHYSVFDLVAHGVCFFVAAAVFYSLAFLLSTMFHDVWRPFLIALAIACVAGLAEIWFEYNGLFHVMSGHGYFNTGSLPWLGILSSAAVSAALIAGAGANIARKDF